MGSKLRLVPLVLALASVPPASAAPGYTITELKPLHGSVSYALDVNVAGQATGVMTDESTSSFAYRGFFYDPKGGLVDIGELGGRNTFAVALNDAGVATGWSQTPSGAAHAFVFTPGVGMRDLGPAAGRSFANDIGESGNVIGGLVPSGHAFVWSDSGGIKDLGAGKAASFNFQGDIFGARGPTSGIWSPPYALFVPIAPIDTAVDISGANVFGHVTGTSGTDAFYWDGETYTKLTAAGLRSSSGQAINDADNAVVHAVDTKGVDVPLLFRAPTSQPTRGDSLNPAGSPFSSLLDFSSIDDLGHIAGNGRVGSDIHAFVLTPPFATQVDTVRMILDGGLPAANPFAAFVDAVLEPLTGADATSCFELRELRGTLAVSRGVPFTTPQREVASNALQALVTASGCTNALPTAPVIVPHVFVRKREREPVAVNVQGAVTILTQFPGGSRFDVVNVRETGAKPKLKTTRTKTSVQVRVSRLRLGTLRFAVVATKLPTSAATPVLTRVSGQ
jgi:probable HAF family extracellular repeat protein